MTLKDDMAADEAVFVNADEFAEPCTFIPLDDGDATGFALNVVPSDMDTQVNQVEISMLSRRVQSFTAWRTTLRSGINARTSNTRDPIRGDRLVFATGHEYQGEWTVQYPEADEGGAVTMVCVLENPVELRAPGSQVVR